MVHSKLPVVISMSDFQAFLRCRKLFQLGNVLWRSPNASNAAVEDGSRIHSVLHDVAEKKMKPADIVAKHGGPEDPMLLIAGAYLNNRPLQGNTLLLEQSIYTLIIDEDDAFPGSPSVYMRTTFDRVFEDDDGWINGVDYKSFERAPSLEDDWNFQFRRYTGALMHHFKTDRVLFRVEYIRRALPGSPRGAWDIEDDGEYYSVDAKGKRTKKEKWKVEDCYITNEIAMSVKEVEEMWDETRDIARDILRVVMVDHRFYRTPLTAGPHSCGTCFMREPCLAELRQGRLSADDLEFMTTPRDDAERMNWESIIADPRVHWYKYQNGYTMSDYQAAEAVYGKVAVPA